MSKFSTYLKKLIDESGETITSIARDIGAERTSIHKALKDERILSYAVVRALASHFQLSLEERQEFFRLHDMLLQGEDVWYNHAAVSEMLNYLSNTQFHSEQPSNMLSNSGKATPPPISEITFVEGEYSVQKELYTIMSAETEQNAKINFQLFLPFGSNQSALLMQLWHNGFHFSADQLFCFPNIVDSNGTQSIRTLQQIIPLCFIARDSYHPYYFYERPGSLDVNPLNYYIVTPHYVIFLSQDQSVALIQHSEQLVNHFSSHFKSLMDHCEPLISCAMTLPDILSISTSMVNPAGTMYLMPQPCFGRYYTPEIIRKYFQSNISYVQNMYDAVLKHFFVIQNVEGKFCTVFSEKGLYDFIETGVITELPQEYVSPIDQQDRIRFLSRLREDIAADNVIGRAARPSALRIPKYLTLCIDANGYTWFDTTSDFIHGAYYCDIHISEKSICHAFKDFFNSLPGSQMVYSKEDTLRMLDEGILKLNDKKPPQG